MDGTDIKNLSLKSWRRSIGLVLQDIYLLSWDYFRQSKSFNSQIPFQRVMDCAKKMHVHNFIMNLPNAYETILEERGANFSLGQRQLLSLLEQWLWTLSFLFSTKLQLQLIHTRKFDNEIFKRLLSNRTSIVIAHRLRTIIDSDRILVIKNGCITESGTHEELIKLASEYNSLFKLQNGESVA